MKLIIDLPDEIYDDIKHGYICSEYADTLIQLIPNSKPYEEQPQGGWVPVSERLPNLDDYTGPEVWRKKVLITGYIAFDKTKNLFVSEAFAKDIVICNRVHDTIVVAWQPLPEPYKEGDTE